MLTRISSPARLLGLSVLCGLLVVQSGCRSRRTEARRKEAVAAAVGMQQAGQAAEQARTTVLVRGPIQTPIIPWRPGLTLSQAIVSARYLRVTDPQRIVLIRQGFANRIDVRRLLKGLDDPELQPGDVIDMQ